MEQLVVDVPPPGSFGVLLRACRHRAYLSQEQLAARAEVSERTVRNLEADRVRSPRTDTVRLLADALHLSERERESWFEVARGVNRQRAAPASAEGGPAPPPHDPPAQPPLTASGNGVENNHLRQRSRAGTYQIVDLCQRADGSAGPAAKDADVLQPPAQAPAGQPGRDAATSSDGELTTADRRELVELRQENRRLREDVEILKRAAAIFVSDLVNCPRITPQLWRPPGTCGRPRKISS
jgi:transposase